MSQERRSRARERLAAALAELEPRPVPEAPQAPPSGPMFYGWADIPPAAWNYPPADLPDGVEPVRCPRCTALNLPTGPCRWCGLDAP